VGCAVDKSPGYDGVTYTVPSDPESELKWIEIVPKMVATELSVYYAIVQATIQLNTKWLNLDQKLESIVDALEQRRVVRIWKTVSTADLIRQLLIDTYRFRIETAQLKRRFHSRIADISSREGLDMLEAYSKNELGSLDEFPVNDTIELLKVIENRLVWSNQNIAIFFSAVLGATIGAAIALYAS
jgi:hypothetical protein